MGWVICKDRMRVWEYTWESGYGFGLEVDSSPWVVFVDSADDGGGMVRWPVEYVRTLNLEIRVW